MIQLQIQRLSHFQQNNISIERLSKVTAFYFVENNVTIWLWIKNENEG